MIHKTKLKVVNKNVEVFGDELIITYDRIIEYNLSNSMPTKYINRSLNINLTKGKYLLYASEKPFKDAIKISCKLLCGYSSKNNEISLLPCAKALNKLLNIKHLEPTGKMFTFYYKLNKI